MDPQLSMNQPEGPQAVGPVFGLPTQSCSENNLKFICELQPGPVPPPGCDESFIADMGCRSVSVILPLQCSIYQLRLRICMQVGRRVLVEWFSLVYCQRVLNLKLFLALCSFSILQC